VLTRLDWAARTSAGRLTPWWRVLHIERSATIRRPPASSEHTPIEWGVPCRSISCSLSKVDASVYGHDEALRKLASWRVMGSATARGDAVPQPALTRDNVW